MGVDVAFEDHGETIEGFNVDFTSPREAMGFDVRRRLSKLILRRDSYQVAKETMLDAVLSWE